MEDLYDDDDDNTLLSMMTLLHSESEAEDAREKRRRTHRGDFYDSLSPQEKRNRRSAVRVRALPPPSESPFMLVYNSAMEDAMITVTGFGHSAFNQLLALFEPEFSNWSPHTGPDGMIRRMEDRTRRGRPRRITPVIALGLVLTWTRTRGSTWILQMVFGLGKTSLDMYLRFSRRLIVKILQPHPDATVRLPTESEIIELSDSVAEKYPALAEHKVWGALDGLKLHIQASGDQRTQNRFFNGWTHGHYINSLFLFTPNGKVAAKYCNAPGCTHDSTMAEYSNMYTKIDDVYNSCGGKVVVDSAFTGKVTQGMLRSQQLISEFMLDAAPIERIVGRNATSVRQLSEWGMRSFQGSFPRLRDKFFYEERGERSIILECIVLLYNYRAATVGHNQIRSSYMAHLNRPVNLTYFNNMN